MARVGVTSRWQPACSLGGITNRNSSTRSGATADRTPSFRLEHLENQRMHHHHRDDHDDMGGLHRDLAATGAVMDRRGVLRLAARFGVGVGMLQMLGCGGTTPTSPSTSGTTTETSTPTNGGTSNGSCSAI